MTDHSGKSRTIVRNTFLLYFRMVLMMFIGLFTSRVILRSLGVNDYGIYNAVGGVVLVFTFLTNSITNSISRYLSFALGAGDKEKIHRIFSTGIIIQLTASALIAILVESFGTWALENKLEIPVERLSAAHWVLHSTLGILILNLLAIPYSAVIMAHERMGAYARISILEAVLKLGVAALIFISGYDKLKTYAVLMLVVALTVRGAYGIFGRKHFEECRGALEWDKSLIKEMSSFAGWSFFGSSAFVFNTQGVSILMNLFFGVVANAARGIAMQVDGIVRQFTTNILVAFNPQITKSWAENDREYAFGIVSKASKYVSLVVILFIIPCFLETDCLLTLWLGRYPKDSDTFTRLTLICVLLNSFCNPLHTLQQATGKIRSYYLITGLTAYLGLPLIYLGYKAGLAVNWAYYILILIYIIDCIEKMAIARIQYNFPLWSFLKESVFRVLAATAFAVPLPLALHFTVFDPLIRLVLVSIATLACLLAGAWIFAMTKGEKEFIRSKGK